MNETATSTRPAAPTSAPAIYSAIETIDPAYAAVLLKHNAQNRAISRRLVGRIAEDILAGRWQVNGQPIVIGASGRLLDGQHRLQAVIDAGIPVQMAVTRGVADAAFASMDCGLSRRPGDVLGIMGIACPRETGATLGMLTLWEQGKIGVWAHIPATSIGELVAGKYKDVPAVVANVASMVRSGGLRTSVSVLASAVYRMTQIDAGIAYRYLEDVCSGANLRSDDPVLVLRRRLAEITFAGTPSRWLALSLMVSAWNMRIRGMRTTKLWAWVSGGRTRFPALLHPGVHTRPVTEASDGEASA